MAIAFLISYAESDFLQGLQYPLCFYFRNWHERDLV